MSSEPSRREFGTTDWFWEARSRLGASQVLSLDFFETLFSRRPYGPADVFGSIERRLDAPGWAQERRERERQAVRRAGQAASWEVTLTEIYSDLLGSPEVELQEEARYLRPVLPLVALARHAREAGLKVAIVSDTYVSSRRLAEWCDAAHLVPDWILSSGERKASKRNGTLFDELISVTGVLPHEITHIGDDSWADFVMPRRKGVSAVWRPQDRNTIEPVGRTLWSLSTRVGPEVDPQPTIDADWLSGNLRLWRDLGRDVLAPGLHHVAEWITEKKSPHSRTVLLGRDLHALHQVVRGTSDYSYFPSSRRAALGAMAALDPNPLVALISSYTSEGLDLARLDLPWPNYLIEKYVAGDEFTGQDLEVIRHSHSGELEGLRDRWQSIVGRDQAPFVLELGWRGTIPTALTRALNLPDATTALVGSRGDSTVDLVYFDRATWRDSAWLGTVAGVLEVSMSEPTSTLLSYGRVSPLHDGELELHDRVRGSIAKAVQSGIAEGGRVSPRPLFPAVVEWIRDLPTEELRTLMSYPLGRSVGDQQVAASCPSLLVPGHGYKDVRSWLALNRNPQNISDWALARHSAERMGSHHLTTLALDTYRKARLLRNRR